MAVDGNYVIVVEHDLTILDFVSDYVCCLFGFPGVYGAVTMPLSVRDGINIYLAGYEPKEKIRFRDSELSFYISPDQEAKVNTQQQDDDQALEMIYPSMVKTIGNIRMTITGGSLA